jgi:hypothetical protein
LNTAELIHFFMGNQGYCLAFGAGASGAADTMDIIFSDHWHVEVYHPGKLLDIETACGDIRGDEDMGFAGLEIAKSLTPGALAFVSVNCRYAKAGCSEVPAKAVGATLGAAGHECPNLHLFLKSKSLPETACDERK